MVWHPTIDHLAHQAKCRLGGQDRRAPLAHNAGVRPGLCGASETRRKGTTGTMTTDQALDLLRQFQTLVVGIVGFTGVIITLLVNARLSRLQHVRQVEHERTVVRTALKAELQAVAQSYRGRIEHLEDTHSQKYGGALLSLDSMTDVYKSMIGRLGLLSESQVQAVLNAYLLVEQLPERLAFLADEQPDVPLIINPHMKKVDQGYAWFPNKNLAAVAQMHLNYLRDVDAAATALSN
jgi:hypothetical protein